MQVTLAVDEDGGDASYSSESDSDAPASPVVKRKQAGPPNKAAKRARVIETDHPDTLEDQEALALKLLGADF